MLGISFEMGVAIARQWGFPSLIVSSMRRLPSGAVKKPTQQDDVCGAVRFANELCEVIAQATPRGAGSGI